MIDRTELTNALVAIKEQATTREKLAARLGKDIAATEALIKDLKKERLIFGSVNGGMVEYALTSRGLGFLIGARRMQDK